MKVVLDANVVIAAFATRGLCHAVLEHCLDNHDIILCEPLVDEICNKLRRKVKVPEEIVEEITQLLRAHTTLVEPVAVDPKACRDKEDLMVLGTAVSSKASCIVTGDEDLLSLESYSGIPIVRPKAFWEKVRRRRRYTSEPPKRQS